MDQQHPFTHATKHPDTRADEAGLPEAPGTSAPTVLSEGEWLAVSSALRCGCFGRG